jgi:hypothetical protein
MCQWNGGFSKQEKGYNVRYVAVPGGGVSKAVYFPITFTEGLLATLEKKLFTSKV